MDEESGGEEERGGKGREGEGEKEQQVFSREMLANVSAVTASEVFGCVSTGTCEKKKAEPSSHADRPSRKDDRCAG